MCLGISLPHISRTESLISQSVKANSASCCYSEGCIVQECASSVEGTVSTCCLRHWSSHGTSTANGHYMWVMRSNQLLETRRRLFTAFVETTTESRSVGGHAFYLLLTKCSCKRGISDEVLFLRLSVCQSSP